MIAKLRLISGLILTLFVVGHFINHALGIISLKAMNDALAYFIQPWREPLGEAILLGALVVHAVLALYALYQRRSLKMNRSDMFQFASGFLIPLVIGTHVIGTRGIHEAFGVVEGYQFTLYGMWIGSVFYGVMNLIALPVVWFHACLGWHNWLQYKIWYQRILPFAFGFAVLLPTLALAGYISASFRVARLSNSEKWVAGVFKRVSDRLNEIQAFIENGEQALVIAVPLTLGIVLFLRWASMNYQRSKSQYEIAYRDMALQGEQKIPLLAGATLLDMVRSAGIAHASVCGGRGRCSTCRVRVDNGQDNISPAQQPELKVLHRINAGEDIRLACQTYPSGPMTITALMDASTVTSNSPRNMKIRGGEEQDIVVLFADIRGFTNLSEQKLPYDTAFLLNRYFASMGRAIEEAGGHLDKFIGDGVMALFGVDQDAERGALAAVSAVIAMSEQLKVLNASLKSDLPEPLRIGIGVHCGPAIVGNMGYGRATGLTAIGDTVNIASRLESLTKEHVCQLIISKDTVDLAGLDVSDLTSEKVTVRGRENSIDVHMLTSASELASRISLQEMRQTKIKS